MGSVESEETASTTNITSGNLRITSAIDPKRIAHTAGCFVVNERERVETASGEFLVDHLWKDRVTPVRLGELRLLFRNAC